VESLSRLDSTTQTPFVMYLTILKRKHFGETGSISDPIL
jgi:hypothetical protein